MVSLKKLEDQLMAFLKLDSVQRSLIGGLEPMSAQFGRDVPGLLDQIKRKHGLKTSEETFLENELKIKEILIEIANHNTPDAVESIKKTFKSKIIAHRLNALHALSKMSIPEAKKAIAKRTAWFSSASKEEKVLARKFLNNKV